MSEQVSGWFLHIVPQVVFLATAVLLALQERRKRWMLWMALGCGITVLLTEVTHIPLASWIVQRLLPVAMGTALLTTALSALALVWSARERKQQIESAHEVLDRIGIAVAAEQEVARARRNKESLALLLIEVDNFEAMNAAWGRDMGRRVLRAIGGVLQAESNEGQMVGRLRVQEFAVLLPGCGFDAAHDAAERLREAVEKLKLREGANTLAVTVSIGVGMLRPEETGWGSMLCRADVALLCAKNDGPNHVALDIGSGQRRAPLQRMTRQAA